MVGVNYSIRLDGIEHIRERINELLTRGQNLEPAFQDIGEMLLLSHNERWAKQESPDGQPWQPLSEGYKKRKKKNQSLILVLNQHLGRELNYNAWRTGITFGTPYEYGAIHHFGGTSDMRPQNAAIPARPWLGVSDEDTEQIYQILGDFLTAE
ncbi:phage virion morphogenesis protein [Photobacterium sanguinicancri]|uniref:Phage virion morphogenesis protein n=1 Tax=Photobacterium sanguinicancri TaxID=875932 RepID=A0ABX4FT31_9GAMM|nr:phage virion morphogenesis protein [Photobacterium sanguinicancri]OZS41961.1 phage virion morphogenesis protein [Photobacterium sanguinicancri]